MSHHLSHNLGLNGILIINKPKDWTSFDVVAKIRNKLGVKKVGHTGTLDPMATGVLVLCLGNATKKVQEMTGYDKEYIGEITLGATSNTDDAEGIITQSSKLKVRNSKFETRKNADDQSNSNFEFETSSFTPPTKEEIESVLKEFRGEVMQIPPQFSAKKIDGKRAYAMARKGQTVEMEANKVVVHELELLEYQWPILKIRLLSGKGFYVRALARDLGEKLGVGGYLSALQRTKVGLFTLEQAVTIEAVDISDLTV